MAPEGFNILNSLYTARITSCGVKILISPRPTRNRSREAPVFTKNVLTVPPRSAIAVPISHTLSDTLDNEDFLFEPKESLVSLFMYVTKVSIAFVVARNDVERAI